MTTTCAVSIRINQVCRSIILHRIVYMFVSGWATTTLPLHKVASSILISLVVLVPCWLSRLLCVWWLDGLHLYHVIREMAGVQHTWARVLMVQRSWVVAPNCTAWGWLKGRCASKVHLRSVVLYSVRSCTHYLLFERVLSFEMLQPRVRFRC